jgi:hypothetical protein
MEAIIEQLQATLDCGIWYPVVAGTLMLPDACGAVEFAGTAKRPGDRYKEWYDQWVYPHYNPQAANHWLPRFDGDVVYRLRNALMHETTGFVRGVDGFDRVLFSIRRDFDWSLTGNNGGNPEFAFEIYIGRFFAVVAAAVSAWLLQVRADPDTRRAEAVSKLLQFHPEGVHPHIVGFPLVG